MTFFMFRRLTALMVTLLVASLLIFLLLEILPGDPAAVILGVGAQEDTLRALRAELGLDLPAPVRYLNWLGEVLQGDLGRSYTYDTPVQELLLNRVELSLPLALLAILLSCMADFDDVVFLFCNDFAFNFARRSRETSIEF